MSDYTKQSEEFIAKHGITFTSTYVGEDCPLYCEDAKKSPLVPGTFPRRDHIHGSHYRLTLTRVGKAPFTQDFWDSYHQAEMRWVRKNPDAAAERVGSASFGGGFTTLREKHKHVFASAKNIQPAAYDMLASLTKYDPGTFEEFCSEFGYDEDSLKAGKIYRAVQKEFTDVERFFTSEEIEELAEIS